jgi:anaerobic magnesium-protoporphyrin IX monomethyl ester cyclase
MDVIFVDLPFNTYELGRRFKSAWSHKQFLSPHELHLGFRYMVSSLRGQGYTADILFPVRDNGLTSRADLLCAISEIEPLILAFTSYEGSLKESLHFIRQVKARGVRSLICMGGHLATFSYEEILRDFHHLVDVIVLGEGEHTLVDLVAAVKRKQGFSRLPGIAYYDGSRVIKTGRRPVEPDLDRFPFPLLFIADSWKDSNIPLFLTTSRGCYGHCSFCRSSYFGEGWRARDPENVADEIEHAYRQGVSTFELVDDNFLGPGTVGKKRATAVAAEIQRRGLHIRYHVSCRVNDVEEPTMRALKDSGLISVSLGVESGVQRMLDTFNKNITVEQSIAAVQLLNGLGIPALVYIIFFDPYMSLAEARENVQFLKYVRSLDHVRFEPIIFRKLIPISGTAIFEQIRSDGLLRGNYLNGHYFAFKDRRVALLADFMETLDLRFERALQNEAFRQIDGLYESFKAVFEFSVAEKAIDLLASARWKKEEAYAQLNNLLSTELRKTFGSGLSRAAVPHEVFQ